MNSTDLPFQQGKGIRAAYDKQKQEPVLHFDIGADLTSAPNLVINGITYRRECSVVPEPWQPNPHVAHAIDQAISIADMMRGSEARHALLTAVADIWRMHMTIAVQMKDATE